MLPLRSAAIGTTAFCRQWRRALGTSQLSAHDVPSFHFSTNANATLEDALSNQNQSRRFRRKNNANANTNNDRKRIVHQDDNGDNAWSTRDQDSATDAANNGSQQKKSPRRANQPIRLSKRMSELDLCSRREADRLISAGRVLLGGKPVEQILGLKVDPNEIDIAIIDRHDGKAKDNGANLIRPLEFDWERMRGDTVVLHKPPGYVSGQPEDSIIGGRGRHVPAVQLLTRKNLHFEEGAPQDQELKDILSDGNYLHFTKFQKSGDSWWNDRSTTGSEKRQIKGQDKSASSQRDATLVNYVPSGRLDLDSTGLLIFTKSGVMAKKLVSPQGLVEKEYLVKVSPVQSLTRVERENGMTWLPEPSKDLRPLLRGGAKLFGEHRTLLPVVEAEWIDHSKDGGGNLRIVLIEGMKRQLRRAFRELLGQHVDLLQRTRIADVKLDIPEGRWRPLREHEARSIFFAGNRGK